MTILQAILAVAVVGAASSAAMAGQQVGKVTELWVHPAHVDVRLTAPEGTRAPRSADLYWQFDVSTPASERWLAILLTAQASGQIILIQGTGNCGTTFQREHIQYLRITSP